MIRKTCKRLRGLIYRIRNRLAQGRLVFDCLLLRRRTRNPVVVFFRHGGLGDVICAIPAYLQIREARPTATVLFVTWRSYAPALTASPGVAAAIGVRPGIWAPASLLRCL